MRSRELGCPCCGLMIGIEANGYCELCNDKGHMVPVVTPSRTEKQSHPDAMAVSAPSEQGQ